MGDSTYFNNQIKAFKDHFRLILVDTRGHGKSDRANRWLDFELLASDLLQLMDKLNLDKANILGFSDGANLALVFAKNNPERINKLILNSPNKNLDQIKPLNRVLTYLVYYILKGLSYIFPKIKPKLSVFRLLFSDIKISQEEYNNFDFPVLIIAGEYDSIFLKSYEELAEKIDKARLVIIRNHGHMVAQTSPDEFNKIVLDFLEEGHYEKNN